MEAETSRYGPKQVGRCWVLGMQQNDLISKQSVLIFLVLGAYLRAILALMQYMQTDLNRACSAENAEQKCEAKHHLWGVPPQTGRWPILFFGGALR